MIEVVRFRWGRKRDALHMMRFIRTKILRRYINLRFLSQKNIPHDEIIRIELLVAMCLLSLFLGMTYIFIGLFVHISLLSLLNYFIFFITTIPSVLYLIKKGYYNQAKLVMMFLGNIFMFIKASSLGPNSGMNLSMLIILFALFTFYSIKDYKYIFLSIIINLTSIFILEVTHYSLLGIDQSTNKYEYEFNFISTILFCILFFYVVLKINEHINKKLSRLNNRLTSKNKKLGKINQELDSYVYRASHDLRAPLASMMGICHLMKTETDIEKIKQLNSLQEKCLEKLDSHIHQIINLSKNIKTELVFEKVDLKNMIQEIFDELTFFENASNTTKTIRINQQVAFYSDPYRLKVILNNLLSNSFKYMRKEEKNPTIVCEIEVTPLFSTINITDNGIGIPSNQQNKIFDMFYRGTEKSEGSGLGLYMVKEMIQKLNGTISVYSEENKSTSVSFTIPNHPHHFTNL
jgi:signal transduction histidine kinase